MAKTSESKLGFIELLEKLEEIILKSDNVKKIIIIGKKTTTIIIPPGEEGNTEDE